MYIYRKMPQFARTVFCEHVSFTDIAIIVIDFLCGQVSSYDVYIDVRRSLCKNANERRYIELLYYLLKYSHKLAYNDTIMDTIMTNTKLHILAIAGNCNLRVYARICCLRYFDSSTCARKIIVVTLLASKRRNRQHL